jgi:hypothetical protein
MPCKKQDNSTLTLNSSNVGGTYSVNIPPNTFAAGTIVSIGLMARDSMNQTESIYHKITVLANSTNEPPTVGIFGPRSGFVPTKTFPIFCNSSNAGSATFELDFYVNEVDMNDDLPMYAKMIGNGRYEINSTALPEDSDFEFTCVAKVGTLEGLSTPLKMTNKSPFDVKIEVSPPVLTPTTSAEIVITNDGEIGINCVPVSVRVNLTTRQVIRRSKMLPSIIPIVAGET